MILALSLAVAVVFAAGTFLLLQRDLLRVVVGIIMIANSAVLFLIAAGLRRAAVPVLPIPPGERASDPLVQALAVTALVIGSSVAALLLSLAYRLYTFRGTVDLEDFAEAEARAAEALERDEDRTPDEGRPAESAEEWVPDESGSSPESATASRDSTEGSRDSSEGSPGSGTGPR